MNCPLRRLLTASDGAASLRAMADIRHDDDPYRSAVEAALEGEEEGRWFCSVTRTLEGPDPRGDVH